MTPSANSSGSPAAALLLIAIASSSSLAAAVDTTTSSNSPAGVTCVDPSLHFNQCLTAGSADGYPNAICSPSGGWAFGVDPADQRIKLWEGNQVRMLCLPSTR